MGEVKPLAKDITAEQALEVLVKKGVIGSPSYWRNAILVVKSLDELFIKMATKLEN